MGTRWRALRRGMAFPLAMAAILSVAGATPAEGKPVIDEDYTLSGVPGGGIVSEHGGRKGFTLSDKKILDEGGAEYGGGRFSSREGAVQVLVARASERTMQDFILKVDGGFSVYLDWRWDVPAVVVDDESDPEPPRKANNNVWGWLLPFPFAPAVGEWVVVTLSWGPGAQDNTVYVNGTPLVATQPPDLEKQRPVFSGSGRVFLGHDEPFQVSKRAKANEHTEMTVIGGLKVHQTALSAEEVAAIAADWLGTATPVASVEEVTHDAARVAGFSGKLVAGNTLGVTVRGTPGVRGTFDVAHYPDIDRKISLDWRGWGVYLEEKTFFDEDEVDLRDVEGYRVIARRAAFNPLNPELEPTAELDVKEQSYLLEDLEIDTPYYVAVVAVMRGGALRPVIVPPVLQALAEVEPGVYTGAWQAGYRDRFPRAAVVGRLGSGEAAATLAAAEPFTVDPSLRVAVATNPQVLKADEKSRAKVTVTVTDANGNAVPGHEIRFLLATTSQYTGVVGGGAFKEQVGGALKADHRGVTDLFGRVTATYVAGFAAKTAVIVARDMASDSTGAGYVQTYIQSTAQLELEPAQLTEAMAAGYEITVTSSDEWLTADGKSQARITARVTLGGEPVEGHRVAFQIAGGTGQIRTVSEKTGRDGEARAVYTAGTKIGLVLITATDTTVDISGSVQIELRSDAPAKIAVTIDPEKLPADGRSRAEVTVLVTDINDNPNDNVEVEYAITEGGGDLEDRKGLTDRRGESQNTYTAGRTPGRVSIEITVRSTVPTEEEIRKARDLAVAVTDYRFFR